jgi:hypothetical protein
MLDSLSFPSLHEDLAAIEFNDSSDLLCKLRDALCGCLATASCYGWVTDVFAQLYTAKEKDMAAEAIIADGGFVVVKDGHGSGFAGLWIVEAQGIGNNSSLLKHFKGLPFSSMTAHVGADDEVFCIRAVNPASCLKLRKI